VKVGVIGFGYWGPNLVRNLFASRRCQSVHCFDAAPKALHNAIGRFPLLIPETSLENLLAVSDAVMIATPVKSYYTLAREALAAGNAVFVEKPMTSSFAEGAKLLDFAAQKRLPLMTGHTFLYSPAVLKIREYIDDGTLGEIFSLSSSRVNLGIHRQDVNVIWDLAPHDISMLLYWLQESPTRVAAMGRACVGSNIDVASLHLEFPSGCIANIEVSWLAPNKLRRTVVVGSHKMVVYDDTLANEKIKLYDSSASVMSTPASFGEYQLTYRSGDLLSPAWKLPNRCSPRPTLSSTGSNSSRSRKTTAGSRSRSLPPSKPLVVPCWKTGAS
jgi:predicted dehydrogenase